MVSDGWTDKKKLHIEMCAQPKNSEKNKPFLSAKKGFIFPKKSEKKPLSLQIKV